MTPEQIVVFPFIVLFVIYIIFLIDCAYDYHKEKKELIKNLKGGNVMSGFNVEQAVLTNLKNYNLWDCKNYPLEKKEADVIIQALEDRQKMADDLDTKRKLIEANVSGYATGVKTGRNDAIDECIKVIEECVYKDLDMLVELIRELKESEDK